MGTDVTSPGLADSTVSTEPLSELLSKNYWYRIVASISLSHLLLVDVMNSYRCTYLMEVEVTGPLVSGFGRSEECIPPRAVPVI